MLLLVQQLVLMHNFDYGYGYLYSIYIVGLYSQWKCHNPFGTGFHPPPLWANYIGTAPFPGRGFPAVLEYSHLNCFLAWLRWPSVRTTLFPTRWFVKGGHIWFRITSLQRDKVSYFASIGGLRRLPEDLLLQICMKGAPQIYEGKTLLYCKS